MECCRDDWISNDRFRPLRWLDNCNHKTDYINCKTIDQNKKSQQKVPSTFFSGRSCNTTNITNLCRNPSIRPAGTFKLIFSFTKWGDFYAYTIVINIFWLDTEHSHTSIQINGKPQFETTITVRIIIMQTKGYSIWKDRLKYWLSNHTVHLFKVNNPCE